MTLHNTVGLGQYSRMANLVLFLHTAKATDENLTSENWEFILVRYLRWELELWTRALTFVCLGFRMFVIKSLRKNLGMSLHVCYGGGGGGVVWKLTV